VELGDVSGPTVDIVTAVDVVTVVGAAKDRTVEEAITDVSEEELNPMIDNVLVAIEELASICELDAIEELGII
jgi:3-keto-L-gulonate-6-phosphate decarboxylase